MKLSSSFRRRAARYSVILALPFVFTSCFNILHYIDIGKDGSLSIRWRMGVSAALAEMSEQNAEPGKKSMTESLAEAEQEIKAAFGSIAQNIKVMQFKNPQASGLDVQLNVKDPKKLKQDALPEDEMPILPAYDAGKKKLTFRFTQSNTSSLQGEEEQSPTKPMGPKDDGAGEMDDAEDSAGGEGEAEGGMAEDDGIEENPYGPGAEDGMAAMSERLGALFGSMATYDIFLGPGVKPKAVYIQTLAGEKVDDLEILKLGEQHLVRFPLLGMMMQFEDGFELVVEMK